jgi:hypothetical protein
MLAEHVLRANGITAVRRFDHKRHALASLPGPSTDASGVWESLARTYVALQERTARRDSPARRAHVCQATLRAICGAKSDTRQNASLLLFVDEVTTPEPPASVGLSLPRDGVC